MQLSTSGRCGPDVSETAACYARAVRLQHAPQGSDTPRCNLEGCKREPHWRPFVYVPIERLSPEPKGVTALAPRPIPERDHDLVIVPLPMLVCDVHKLPHRLEDRLFRSTRFRRLLARRIAAHGRDWLVRMDRAWVVHERVADERSGS